MKRKELIERFWAKVKIVNDADTCWEWQAHRDKAGYGRSHGEENYAHRQVWRFVNGRIPRGLRVLHRCDNPPCVRPDHLFLGTLRDNAQDCIRKGRFVRANHVKMSMQQVVEARRRYAGGESQRVIGESMGISQAHISKVVRRTLWVDAEAMVGESMAEMRTI